MKFIEATLWYLMTSTVYYVESMDPVTTEGCGNTKGCVHYPAACSSPNCDAILTWRKTEQNYIDFELMATTDGWVAVGFSLDTLMTDDSVIHCLVGNTVGLSFNPGQYNTVINGWSSTVLKNTSISYIQGQLHCRFQRSIQASGSQIFALNNNYYLLLGLGPLQNGAITKHRKDPYVSPRPVDVTEDMSDLTGSNSAGSPALTTPIPPTNAGSFQADGNSVTFDAKTDFVTVVLSGRPGDKWVAVGFSDDKEMGDDSVVSCSVSSQTVVSVRHVYTVEETVQYIDNDTSGISAVETSYNNGIVYCKFNRQVTVPGNSKIFDLNKAYYIFLGSGPTDNTGALLQHARTPSIFPKTNVMTFVGSMQPSAGKNVRLIQAHGCLMITAWILLVSPSIILARYFKTAWPGDQICSNAVWFVVHQTLMLIALACTIAGFIIIFAYAGRPDPEMVTFPGYYPAYFWVHGPLGIIVMILVILNPIIAAVRCKPDSSFRPIFNWIHWTVGTSCYIIAMITIFFGAKMGESEGDLKVSHIAIFWILIAFVGYHCFTEIALIIHKFMEEDIMRRNMFVTQEYELTSHGGHAKRKSAPQEASLGGLIFRYILLALYGIVTLGLWLAMIILIGHGSV
jgi:hypothetical protein